MNGDVLISGVCKRFGEFVALDDVSLQVAGGKVVCLIGPSGAGKSTLIRCINLLETYDSGDIRVANRRVAAGPQLADIRTNVGMVFQSFNLFPHRTALQNITLAPQRVHGLNAETAKERAQSLLARVGMTEHGSKYPAQLSGGQQQRVAIARALAMQPRVLLFDEPTSALDPEMVGEVLDVIRDLAGSGVTLLIVTHEMQFAAQIADEVVFMDAGRIVERASPDELFGRPQKQRTIEFLSTVNH